MWALIQCYSHDNVKEAKYNVKIDYHNYPCYFPNHDFFRHTCHIRSYILNSHCFSSLLLLTTKQKPLHTKNVNSSNLTWHLAKLHVSNFDVSVAKLPTLLIRWHLSIHTHTFSARFRQEQRYVYLIPFKVMSDYGLSHDTCETSTVQWSASSSG